MGTTKQAHPWAQLNKTMSDSHKNIDRHIGERTASDPSDAADCSGFQITDDFRMVYNLRETGRYCKGLPEVENEITIDINSRFLSAEQLADVARTIKKALNDLFYPTTMAEMRRDEWTVVAARRRVPKQNDEMRDRHLEQTQPKKETSK